MKDTFHSKLGHYKVHFLEKKKKQSIFDYFLELEGVYIYGFVLSCKLFLKN